MGVARSHSQQQSLRGVEGEGEEEEKSSANTCLFLTLYKSAPISSVCSSLPFGEGVTSCEGVHGREEEKGEEDR